MADAGTSLDGGDEKQEGQHGTVLERGLGLEGLKVFLFPKADGFSCVKQHISRCQRLASHPAGVNQ